MSLIMRTMSSICSGSTIESGQMIVDLGIGQEALFFAFGDQVFDARLLLLAVHLDPAVRTQTPRHGEFTARGAKKRIRHFSSVCDRFSASQ